MAKNLPPPMKMRVERNSLVPATSYDAERLASYRVGSTVNVRFTADRMRPLERKYRAILGKVVKECSTPWSNAEAAHQALKLACGYVNVGKTASGQFMQWPRSIADFDDAEMQDYYESVLVLLSKLVGVDVETLTSEAADVGEDREEPVAEPAEISHDNSPNTDGAVSPSASDEASDPSPPSVSLASTYHEWLLNVSRMMWAATNYEGDVEVLRNQVSATKEAYPKPEGIPEIFGAKATSVYGYCKRITEGEIDPEDGLSLVAGVVGVDQNQIKGK